MPTQWEFRPRGECDELPGYVVLQSGDAGPPLHDIRPWESAAGQRARLAERGVRFIEFSCLSYNLGGGNRANPWDNHGRIKEGHEKMARQVDRPIAALLSDILAS